MSNPIRDIPNEIILTVYRAFGPSFWNKVQDWDNSKENRIEGKMVFKGSGFLDNFKFAEGEEERGVIVLNVLNKIFEVEGEENHIP